MTWMVRISRSIEERVGQGPDAVARDAGGVRDARAHQELGDDLAPR